MIRYFIARLRRSGKRYLCKEIGIDSMYFCTGSERTILGKSYSAYGHFVVLPHQGLHTKLRYISWVNATLVPSPEK
jgi:hypothetical protein